MPTINRNETLRRAAEMRATIIAYINSVGKPVSRNEIKDALLHKLKELHYEERSVDNFLYTMSKNKLIQHVERKPSGGYLYGPGLCNPDIQEKDIISLSPKTKKKRISKMIEQNFFNDNNVKEAIKVDLIKSTGKLRITFKGLLIEIGIIDE